MQDTHTPIHEELRWLVALLSLTPTPHTPFYNRREVLNEAPVHGQLLLQLLPEQQCSGPSPAPAA